MGKVAGGESWQAKQDTGYRDGVKDRGRMKEEKNTFYTVSILYYMLSFHQKRTYDVYSDTFSTGLAHLPLKPMGILLLPSAGAELDQQ